jgi:glutaredoxin 3
MFAIVSWLLVFTAKSGQAFVHTNTITPLQHTNPTGHTCLSEMKRPILDQLASTLFRVENARVQASSKVDEQGRVGEPMEWSEKDSWANQFSEWLAGASFKQWVADRVAGEYDAVTVQSKIDLFIQENAVAIFSFTTCPFCRRAKDFLQEKGISYAVMELDELEDGNQIRAVLGRMTGRTSVPAIFVHGKFIGGCNDGPGLLPVAASGELDRMLQERSC